MNEQLKRLFDDVYHILGNAGKEFFKDGNPNVPLIAYSIGCALGKITIIQEKLESECDKEAK